MDFGSGRRSGKQFGSGSGKDCGQKAEKGEQGKHFEQRIKKDFGSRIISGEHFESENERDFGSRSESKKGFWKQEQKQQQKQKQKDTGERKREKEWK